MPATNTDARVFLVLLAARRVGDYVYAWGGEGEHEGGFDCSGYASTVLTETARAYPHLYDGGRRTAAGLFEYFDDRGLPTLTEVGDLRPGCLVFYRHSGRRIHHVAIHAAHVPPLRLAAGSREVGPIAFESGGSGSAATSPRGGLLTSAGVRLTASDRHGRAEWLAKDPFAL